MSVLYTLLRIISNQGYTQVPILYRTIYSLGIMYKEGKVQCTIQSCYKENIKLINYKLLTSMCFASLSHLTVLVKLLGDSVS